MNTIEFDIVIISTALIDIFSFLEISSISSECFSLKCFRKSFSSILLRLKSQDEKIQFTFNNCSSMNQVKKCNTWKQVFVKNICEIIVFCKI